MKSYLDKIATRIVERMLKFEGFKEAFEDAAREEAAELIERSKTYLKKEVNGEKIACVRVEPYEGYLVALNDLYTIDELTQIIGDLKVKNSEGI